MYSFVTRRKRIAASFLSSLLAMSLVASKVQAIDFIAPQIEHKITSEGVKQGDDHLITASVTDDTGVDSVVLHYRQRGSRDFNPVVMRSLDGSALYEALIVGQDINSAGIEYFFEAADSSGNTIEMYGSDGEPFAITVLQRPVAIASKNNSAVPMGMHEASSQKGNSSQSVLPIKKNSSNKTWLWAGLGILAAAVVVGAAGGGGGSDVVGGQPSDNTGDLDIATPIPVN